MSKILWVWKFDYYGTWYNVIYDSGRQVSYIERDLPKTVRDFISSAKQADLTFTKYKYFHGAREERKAIGEEYKTLFYKSTDGMDEWLLKKLEEKKEV